MAAPKKKRAVEEEMEILEERGEAEGSSDGEEDGEDMNEEDGSSDEVVDQEIQVEFEARTAEDSDFQGIRKLLAQLFLKANVNLSELTDTLVGQNYVGSVIKQVPPSEDDDDDDMDDDSCQDVYGVISCVNITDRQNLECMKQVKSMLLDKCSPSVQKSAPKKQQELTRILEEESVGFLLSERFINIPAQIALPSYESLWKELERAVKKKMKYSFSHYLMISKTYKLPETAGAAAGGSKKKKRQQTDAGVRMFTNAEEEYFYDEAALSFDYSVKHERDTVVSGTWDDEDEEYEPFRTVIVVNSDRIPVIMKRMTETLSMAPQQPRI